METKQKIKKSEASNKDFSELMINENDEVDENKINERVSNLQSKGKKDQKILNDEGVDIASDPRFKSPQELMETHYLASENFPRVIKFIVTPLLLILMALMFCGIANRQLRNSQPISLKDDLNTSEVAKEILPEGLVDDYYYEGEELPEESSNLEVFLNSILHFILNMDLYSEFVYGDSQKTEDSISDAKEINDDTWLSLYGLYSGRDISQSQNSSEDMEQIRQEREAIIEEKYQLIKKGTYVEMEDFEKIEIYERLQEENRNRQINVISISQEDYLALRDLIEGEKYADIGVFLEDTILRIHKQEYPIDERMLQAKENGDQEKIAQLEEEYDTLYREHVQNLGRYYVYSYLIEYAKGNESRAINQLLHTIEYNEKIKDIYD